MRQRAGYQRSLIVLISLVALVLLIACANVAIFCSRAAPRGGGRSVCGWRWGRSRASSAAALDGKCRAGIPRRFARCPLRVVGKDLLVAMHPLGWGGPGFLDLRLDVRVLGSPWRCPYSQRCFSDSCRRCARPA